MSKNNRNAILLTTVEGEQGVQGLPGPLGFPVQHGTGNPNSITTLTYPDYSNDPGAGSGRGSEEIIFQDTVTGDIWAYQYLNGVPVTGVWVLVDNNRGLPGNPAPPNESKVDISFGSRPGAPYTEYYINYQETNIATNGDLMFDFIHPGTDNAPGLTSATPRIVLGRCLPSIEWRIVEPSADGSSERIIASVITPRRTDYLSLYSFVTQDSWPTERTDLKIKACMREAYYGTWVTRTGGRQSRDEQVQISSFSLY